MKKKTQEQKNNWQIFKYSRCNGCSYAQLDGEWLSSAIWFQCQAGAAPLNKPLMFTVKCSSRVQREGGDAL